MNRSHGRALALLLLLGATLSPASAGSPCDAPEVCEPGYRWVEETTYKEVVREVCKVVPSTKKVRKIVYSTREEPFCLRKGSLKSSAKVGCGEDGCEQSCPRCKGPYRKIILVKTEITTEEPTLKCVTECVVEKVPCTVRRKVPCEAATTPKQR